MSDARQTQWSRLQLWKKTIKSRLKGAAAWRDAVFYAFGPEELQRALEHLGLKPGDTAFVHSSFDAFRGFRGKPSDVIGTLQAMVGKQGIVMMPTMCFSGTAADYAHSHPLVDNHRAQSRMGLVTEIFRRCPGVIRSVHPTHPIAVWGDRADAVTADHHRAQTPCGNPSPLHKLLDRDGKILFLGTDIDVLTFFHTLEEIFADRLPFDPFTAETFHLQVRDESGQVWDCATRLYEPTVSARRNLAPLRRELQAMGAWRARRVGKLDIVLVTAREVATAAGRLLDRGIYCYD